jgi:deoxyribodipyrimidine photolyase-related protein
LKKLVLVLGDQLDIDSPALKNIDPQLDQVVMIESANEAQHVWSHKAKIALFLSAMRHFAQHLNNLGLPLIYIQHSPKTIVEELRNNIIEGKFTHLVCVEPGEWRLKVAIEELAS